MEEKLRLKKGLMLTRNGLGVYLEEEKTLVIADLHIGLEFAFMGEGTYLPILQYPNIEKSILDLISETKAEKLVINGDFKHEFAKTTSQEWTEILNLWDAVKDLNADLELVRGNHDNYLINILKHRGKSIFDPSLTSGPFLITHGHKDFSIPEGITTIILAHEHPALAFRDDAGGKHKFKCYLYGELDDYEVIILPAYSPMAAGAAINSKTKHRFMSNWLNSFDNTELKPIVIDSGEMLQFPPLKDLEPVDYYDEWLDKLEIYEKQLDNEK